MSKVTSESISTKFQIKRLSHHNSITGFTVAKVKFLEYNSEYMPTSEHYIIGFFASVFEQDIFEGAGCWNYDDKFGHKFKIDVASRVYPHSKQGMEEFLMRFVKGIGKATAKRIVDAFGDETIYKIEEDVKNLESLPKIGKKKAENIQKQIVKARRFDDVAMFVLSHGGNYRTAIHMYEEFGDTSIQKMRENPYLLLNIKGIAFRTADEFAHALKHPFNSKERLEKAVLSFLEHCRDSRGDLYVLEQEITLSLKEHLDKYGSYKGQNAEIEKNEIVNALKGIVKEKQIMIEINDDEERCVYLANHQYVENKIVQLLNDLLAMEKMSLASTSQIEGFIASYENEKGMRFAERQKEAIYMALQNGMSILTGGPGTGKTQTINSIIQCIQYVKKSAKIHLSAPTGKASKRMTELTGMEAKTIHRMINLNAFDDGNDVDEIEGDLLVVDEASMVDAFVFYKLLSSVQGDTRILFVGDHNQLPSVGAGLILRDLINSEKIPTTKLNEIFRQAQNSQIVMNAHKIIEGKGTEDIDDPMTFDKSKGDFYFLPQNERLKIKDMLIRSVKRFLSDEYDYTIDDIQILSPMRKTEIGVWEINKAMQDEFNPRDLDKVEYRVNEMFILREGDKVMQTTNNYDLDVFNGEIGKILSIFENDEGDISIEVIYDEDKTVVYDEMCVEELTHAWCLTIHKSQGSEYPIVLMPIHPSHEHMLNKNLIYTGVTRAKKVVVMIGNKATLNKAIKRVDQTKRNSLIKEKLKKVKVA